MKTYATIDYTPLNRQKALTAAFDKTMKKPVIIIGITAAVVLTFYLAYIRQPWVHPIFYGAIFLSLIVMQQYKKEKDKTWELFAKVNGWESLGSQAAVDFVPPSIAVMGDDKHRSSVIRALIDGKEWHLLVCSYVTGSGKSRREYSFTIMHRKLSKHLPYMALDSKMNSGGIERIPEGSRKISLEGDFDEFFSLYLQEGSHIDILSIISPDVMRTLIDNNQQQDIEIIDDNLYFISVSDQRDASQIPAVIYAARTLDAELSHRIKTLQYDPKVQLKTAKGLPVAAISAGTVVYRDKNMWQVWAIWIVVAFVITSSIAVMAWAIFLTTGLS